MNSIIERRERYSCSLHGFHNLEEYNMVWYVSTIIYIFFRYSEEVLLITQTHADYTISARLLHRALSSSVSFPFPSGFRRDAHSYGEKDSGTVSTVCCCYHSNTCIRTYTCQSGNLFPYTVVCTSPSNICSRKLSNGLLMASDKGVCEPRPSP